MLAPTDLPLDLNAERQGLLPAEVQFYQSYHPWCLSAYLTVGDAVSRLREEIEKFPNLKSDWQIREASTNVFLLSCGLLNCIDVRLRGVTLRLPGRLAATAVGRAAGRLVEAVSREPRSQRRLCRWRQQWLSSLNDFLLLGIGPRATDAEALAECGRKLTCLLEIALPSALRAQHLGIASPFGHLDLAPNDVLKLGDCFVRRFPDRAQPILLVGLRTSGSYFAPLLRALLEAEGYRDVGILTIEPNKDAGRRENRELVWFAARGYLALIVDDPPNTSRTLFKALSIVRRAGFASEKVKFIAPTHPANRAWFKAFSEDSFITLQPEHWYKSELLDPKAVELRLSEYFHARNFIHVSVVESSRAQAFNVALASAIASDQRGVRLKRIFEVQLESRDGEKHTKYVLAKSVGWGWLSYRAFLAGHRLSGYVPPILGLREGILYMEWIPQPPIGSDEKRMDADMVQAAACYVAARARELGLGTGSAPAIDVKRHSHGGRLLQRTLSRAYGPLLSDTLMRPRMGHLLRDWRSTSPAFIDGNMRRSEWISTPRGLLKTDFEHHGMGKNAPNVTDPAYDLAETILDLALSPEQERHLITRYVVESGDTAVEQRLFMHKFLAGLWAMSQTLEHLFSSTRGKDAQCEHHRRFMGAWNFLIVHTARHCGSHCHPRADLRWRSPLVVLDIDGVIDRRFFGFPCTTAAGVKALSLLSAHDFAVALNTARSASEVRDYCNAYALAGGVAEHGSYLWDGVRQREQVLISTEAAGQLSEMRRQLQRIPGVFLDERHQYSIRAFTYREIPSAGRIRSLLRETRSSVGDGALAPISTDLVQKLLVDLQLDRLTFHHTTIDTAIVASEVDKGSGLAALRQWALSPDADTIAVGDSESDLPMFRAATRCFAPSSLDCRHQALQLGCQIAPYPFQRGLLDIVRRIIHPDNARCERCDGIEETSAFADDLFLSALKAADQRRSVNLRRAISNPAALGRLRQLCYAHE